MRIFPTIKSRPLRFVIGGLSTLVLALVAILASWVVISNPSFSCRRQGFAGSITQQSHDSMDGTYFYASCQYRFVAEYWPDWSVREVSPDKPMLSTVAFLPDEKQQVILGNNAGGMIARIFPDTSGRSLDDWQHYFIGQYPGSTVGGQVHVYEERPTRQLKAIINGKSVEMVLTSYRGNLLVFESYGTATGNDWFGRTMTF